MINNSKRFSCWAKAQPTLCLLLASFLCHASEGVKPTHGHFRLSYESLTLPHEENMGLAGSTLLFNINDWLSVGPGTYGAITGHRGGFITLGMAAGARRPLAEHLDIDGGVFVGAGGGDGGYTLVGGGLMVRAHLGAFITTKQWGNFGVGASYITFPNGKITSTQPYLAYEYPFEILKLNGWVDPLLSSRQDIPPTESEFDIIYKTYFVSPNVTNLSGSSQYKTIDLMGAEWYHYINEHYFVKVESEGAMGGHSNGYMQILMGGGYRHAITDSSFLKIAGQLGVAGGGGVATGGGFLLDASIGLQQYLTHSLYVALNGGYTDAPTGNFNASSVGLQLGYGFDTPKVTADCVPFSDLGGYKPQHLRVRTTNQTYFKGNSDWRHHHTNENVNLLGLQLDYFINKNYYVSGQGIGAYQGNAGAYMTGLIGPGVYLPLGKSPFFFDAEGLIGAAGGGGLDVGGGFAWQTNAGLGYKLSNAFSLLGYYGYINAPKGHLSANVLGVSLSYNFTLFSKQNTN